MNVINISKRKFEALEKYKVDKKISHTECQLYLLNNQINQKLLKIFFIREGTYFGNKLLTINSLVDSKEEINIEELIMPEKLASIQNKLSGFLMPFIENYNLQTLLQSLDVSFEDKVNYLKQISRLISRVHKTRPYNQSFYLSDIHEANFLYDIKKKRICAIDMDGCKIANNDPSPIKYLSINPFVKNMPFKYIIENGKHLPNKNSEYFCFSIMVLNTLSNTNISRLSINDYYSYIQYLRDLGFSYELLESFDKLYIASNNLLPYDELEEISRNKKTPRATYKVFEYLNKKK